jgi:hypothetical protein
VHALVQQPYQLQVQFGAALSDHCYQLQSDDWRKNIKVSSIKNNEINRKKLE